MNSELYLKWLKVKRHWRSVGTSPRARRDAGRAEHMSNLLAVAGATRERLCRGLAA